MTETPHDPNQSSTSYSIPPTYPAPPTYPTPPAPAQPSAPAPSAPPPAQPPVAASAPTPTYPTPMSTPVAPGQYPTAVMPVSAYPTTGYPGYPPAPPARARTSAWTWVLAAVSAVLLLAAGGLGYGYYAARSEIEDRNRRITELQGTVAERDDQLEAAQENLADAEADLADLQACVDAMEAFIDLPPGSPDAELDRVIDEMFEICGF